MLRHSCRPRLELVSSWRRAGRASAGNRRLRRVLRVDALSGSQGAEAVTAHLDRLVCAAQEAAEHYGASFHGTDIGPDGGKMILLAEFPSCVATTPSAYFVSRAKSSYPPGQLPDRASHRRQRRKSVRLLSRRRARTSADLLDNGDAVNLAARVMGQARPRQVLATAETSAGFAIPLRRTGTTVQGQGQD